MSIDSTRQLSENLHNRYAARFAGYPRLTRDLGEMSSLIAGAQDVLEQASALEGAEAVALKDLAQERLDLYTKEKEAIAAAKESSQEAKDAMFLGQRANRVIHLYRRHFAGKNRRTRDLGLLGEMVDTMADIQEKMEALSKSYIATSLKNDLQTVTSNLEMYKTERGEIVNARSTGTTSEQADNLAAIANNQFALYQAHFAGKSRLSRRPELLQRIINNLQSILETMLSLQNSGLTDTTHRNNINAVTTQVNFYKNELAAIHESRNGADIFRLADSLGQEANTIMNEYRDGFAGQNRATRDLDLLTTLSDRLYELNLQMEEINSKHDFDAHRRNHQIVQDNLVLFEREFGFIQEAKGDKK